MIIVEDYKEARRVLSSKSEFGPPAMVEYVSLLESETGLDFSSLKNYLKHFLPFMHGDEHLRLRKLVNRCFTRAEVKKWTSLIENIVRERLAKIDRQEKYDLIIDIVDPFYMDLIEKLFGVQIPDRQKFIRQIEIATNAVERMSSVSQLQKLQQTLQELDALISHQLHSLNNETLFYDIVQNIKDDLHQDEIISILLVLLIAPRATTETIAHVILAYSKLDTTELDKYSSTAWVDEHINDLIRLYASTNMLSKEAKEELQIGGCPVASGTQVLINIPEVNRDAQIYGIQTTLNALSGNSNQRKHLTFGAGGHICIGAELAKEIIRIFIPAFFAEFSSVTCNHESISYYKAQIATRLKTAVIIMS